MLKIGVVGGLSGKMSNVIINEINKISDVVLSGFFGKNEQTVNSFSDLCNISDVIIDFTTPEATMECVKYIENKVYVCGTTGLSNYEIEEIKKYSKNAKILLSENMSVGIAILQYALKSISKFMNDFDIEILEKHHNQKVDYPSGTAIAISKNIANLRNLDYDKSISSVLKSGKREKDKIHISSLRGGTVVGEHTVFFFGNKEVIEFTHKAEDRSIFATGAIKLGKLLHSHNKNGFFNMEYVIELMKLNKL